MRRKFLCGLAALFCSAQLTAQPVPARDLWDFPLGAVLEPAAMATEAGTGLWNPASAALPFGSRLRLGVAAVTTATDQSVDAQLFGVAWRRPSGLTVGFSLANAAISGISRTDTDPDSRGEVPYYTWLVSGTVAREVLPHVTAGVSVRWRQGRADRTTRSAIAADMGVIVDHLPWYDLRLAASSFLWRPGHEIDDHPVLLMAIDARVVGKTDEHSFRIGLERNTINRGVHETGPFAGLRVGVLEVKGAFLRSTAYDRVLTRARSGVAMHYARYIVSVAREEGTNGLGPLYQFTLSSVIK